MRYISVILVLAPVTALGSFNSVGPNGVDVPFGLDGSGVLIGEADADRSGKAGYDGAARAASGTVPAGVYFQNNAGMDPAYPNPGSHIGEHATAVASVMISRRALEGGVAPMAQLHSIGLGETGTDPDDALVLNRLAAQIGAGAISAINMSYGVPMNFDLLEKDGKSHITQFVDWSARQHDVLYVVAWINDDLPDEFFKPQDNFNGITVAGSEPDDNLEYYRVSPVNINDSDLNDQYSIDLLAPGDDVLALGWNDLPDFEDGSSYAAPHVTGAVAVLQQYAQKQIDDGNPRFIASIAKRHDVMKALLINSADKLAGVHGSTRTICDTPGPGDCHDWTESEAFTSSFIPLDDKMGAGHLNVRRAVQQFAPGEYDPAGTVPLIGWDRGVIGPFETNEYIFAEAADGYIAITLA
jgi:subtilisin family serine protease